jgi:hypothetical protein
MASSPTARDDHHPISRVDDRLVLFVPAYAVSLVPLTPDYFNDLAAPRWLAVQAARLDQVSDVGSATRWVLRDHCMPI